MTQTIGIDIHGQICPSRLLLALKEPNSNGAAIRAGNAEAVVMTDARHATAAIPATADRTGFRTGITCLDDACRIHILSGA